jgi:phospholipid/cholesterol/gamma-HCH transport system substrate-binding protein
MDGTAHIRGLVYGENLMDEFRPVVKSLSRLAESINELVNAPEEQIGTQPGKATAATGPSTRRVSIRSTLAKLNNTLDALTMVVGDPENQQNFKQTLAGLREFTASARDAMAEIRAVAQEAQKTAAQATLTAKSIQQVTTRTGDNIDALASKLIKDAEDISAVMTSLNKTIVKLESGQGTTGKLISDPKLYNNLVDVSDQLNAMIKDFRALTQQWKDRGMGVKLK